MVKRQEMLLHCERWAFFNTWAGNENVPLWSQRIPCASGNRDFYFCLITIMQITFIKNPNNCIYSCRILVLLSTFACINFTIYLFVGVTNSHLKAKRRSPIIIDKYIYIDSCSTLCCNISFLPVTRSIPHLPVVLLLFWSLCVDSGIALAEGFVLFILQLHESWVRWREPVLSSR